jgi:predicted phosphohydrolase
VNGDILILAGDIVPFEKQELADTFFDLWSKQFERVFWVAGNHEFYGSDIHLIPLQRNETVRHNIHRINNEIVILEDVVFIFSTLWSKISLLNEQKIMRGMADFRYIRNGENKFLATDYNDRHASSILFIQEMLTRYRHKRTVVVTHHIPTFYSYPPKYRGDILNEGFATEYANLIEDVGPEIWIYGHHHSNVPTFTLGRTQLMTNQLGYVKYSEDKSFDNSKFFIL